LNSLLHSRDPKVDGDAEIRVVKWIDSPEEPVNEIPYMMV
jgi:hypothetical protein